MESREALSCEFSKGIYDYVNTECSQIEVCKMQGGGIIAIVRVSHPSGEWIKSGKAFKTSMGIELEYYTECKGEISFERYGCELQFKLKDVKYISYLKIILITPETQHY